MSNTLESAQPQHAHASGVDDDSFLRSVRDSDTDSVADIVGEHAMGVRRIAAISQEFTAWDRLALWFGVLLVAYAYGLDGVIRYSYQPTAASDLHDHSLIATISVARSVIAAATQPVAAKVADVFGRVEMIYISIFFYVIGTIIEATAQSIGQLAAGSILYQIGYSIIQLTVEVVIADLTSLRSRLFFSYIPAVPFLINTWVSGSVASSVLGVTNWRWGFGMWAVIFPICAMPLLIILVIVTSRAKGKAHLDTFMTPYQRLGAKKLARELFWQLDVVGMLFLIAVFGLLLVPLTLAGGLTSSWASIHIIVPLILGFFMIPVFVWWEANCIYPLIPFSLLKDRGVWGALGIAVFLNFSWYMQGDYLYTVLIIAFNESIEKATRITALYSFVSVLTGLVVGILVRFVKQLKFFIIAGTCIFLVAFGLLIRYRGGIGSPAYPGVIGAQVLLGIGGGLFPYATQVSIQSCTQHDHVAVVTALFLATYFIGSALGNCVSGAYWSNTLPARLSHHLQPFGNETLASWAYTSPFEFAVEYPWLSPERMAVVAAYMETQKVLCIIGACLTVPLILFGICTRNHTLGIEQSLQDAEEDAAISVLHGNEDGPGGEEKTGRPATGISDDSERTVIHNTI